MGTTIELNGKRGQLLNRAYSLILVALIGVGALWALASLSRDTSAQAQAKEGVPPSFGVSDGLDCGHDWAVVTSPSPGNTSNNLYGVAAVSSNDVWAVGVLNAFNSYLGQTLIEHWDGSTWTVVSSPSPGTGGNALKAVAAIAANDVWAVGAYSNNSATLTLIEHWDGSTWSVVPSPNLGTTYNDLYGVAAISANDVWAVGDYNSGTGNGWYRTQTLHWNGTAWSTVPSPNQGTSDNHFNAVAATATNDVWAVGTYTGGSQIFTLTEHWNGTAWSVVTSPNPGSSQNYLNGVAAVAANDVWAVGNYYGNNGVSTLIEHWNGSLWSVVPSPSGHTLKAVAAVAANDVWAVGEHDAGGVYRTLIIQWDGSIWSVVYSPNQNTSDNEFLAVDALSTNDVWAAGDYKVGANTPDTLIERYNTCSGTPTPVPSACPIQYTDVAAGSTFYDYVRCLACRQIVGGYNNSPPCTTGTPCFMPGNNVTRGQMAKFISKAADYQDSIPSTQQSFTDVPHSSAFWLFVERVYLHGVVSGYTSAANCPTGVPCYLPGNNVTRGQAARFISRAADYQDPIPSNQQTFTDVPPSHTFWLSIERVYMHGIVGGYQNSPPCTTGTPCYQPGNNVTRGQTAKFVSKAFFPDCDTP